MNTSVKDIIKKWYKDLQFPEKFDEEFYAALQETEIPENSSIETYPAETQDGKHKLLSYLYFCEQVKKSYEEKGIDAGILYDTLRDLVIWTEIWSDLEGTLCLHEQGWLRRHLAMKIFKLGRLQFSPGTAEMDIPHLGIAKGEPIMEIHIPAVGPMTPEACRESLEKAKAFFAEFYPDYHYRCFTCHSWLMDTSLKELLNEDSNILQFQNMFEVLEEEPDDAILRYVFKWDTTREKLPQMTCSSGFAKRVKEQALQGREFHESYGVMAK